MSKVQMSVAFMKSNSPSLEELESAMSLDGLAFCEFSLKVEEDRILLTVSGPATMTLEHLHNLAESLS
jgi:hypothetical protein